MQSGYSSLQKKYCMLAVRTFGDKMPKRVLKPPLPFVVLNLRSYQYYNTMYTYITYDLPVSETALNTALLRRTRDPFNAFKTTIPVWPVYVVHESCCMPSVRCCESVTNV